MKFPQTICHRKAEVKIYGKRSSYPFYRVTWYAHGKRFLKNLPTYSAVKTAVETKARELAKGSQAAALTAKQARDALAALEVLNGFWESSGRRIISLLQAVSEFTEASKQLGGRPLTEAVEGYLSTVARIERKEIPAAVNEFLRALEIRTKAKEDRRPERSH